MLTTTDNPYNPYVDFDKWNSWDIAHGYNTCAYLARLYTMGGDPNNLMPWEIDMFRRQVETEALRVNITGRYIRAVDPNPDEN